MVLSWFSSRTLPIAVDIGTETIKLLQVEPKGEGQHRLLAAACEMIPDEVRGKPAEHDAFVGEAIRKMLLEGFKGKQVVTCLPAGRMAVQHLRIVKMNNDELQKALPFETAGKLPFDANRAVFRHTVAGDVYHQGEARQEVIVMAATREHVDRHLNIFAKSKLEVVGIHVEPTALIECFSHVFRRKTDETINTLFIDMGAGATHVVIACGTSMAFAKHIPVGGDALNKRVADKLGLSLTKAKEMRVLVSHDLAQPQRLPAGLVGINANAGTHPMGAANAVHAGAQVTFETVERVQAAMEEPMAALIGDLQMCVKYYEATFGRQVDRVIFTGGESRHVPMCQQIARKLALPATLGDPLARLVRDSGTVSKIDLRQPQPGWAIAVGLGLGLSQNAGAAEREPEKRAV